MAGISQIGMVIPTTAVPHVDLGRLESLIWSQEFKSLAAQTQDDRMSVSDWAHCLRFEMAAFLNWLARRTIATTLHSSMPPRSIPSTVVALLPRYGFAVHTLRRAAPFMALGINTLVGVAPECRRQATSVITPPIRALQLEDYGQVDDHDPAELMLFAVDRSVPVYVTGRPQTWRSLKRSFGAHTTIVGATGGCAVVLSGDDCEAAQITAALNRRALNTSCTSTVHTVVIDRTGGASTPGGVVTKSDGTHDQYRCDLDELLHRLHPSVVVSPATGRYPILPTGYTVMDCDADGRTSSLVGFGRDPIAGWPGDYCI
jgi:hypothetical protein